MNERKDALGFISISNILNISADMSIVSEFKKWYYHFPVRWIAQILPVRQLAPFGRWLARLEYWSVFPGTREILARNLAIALHLNPTSDQVHKLARSVVIHYVWDLIEYFQAQRLHRLQDKDFIHLDGFHWVEEAMKQRKGVILVSAHCATFQLISSAIAWKGYPVTMIEPLSTRLDHCKRRLDRMVQRVRRAYQKEYLGYHTVYTGQDLRRAFDILRQGGVVHVAADMLWVERTVDCRFLGAARKLGIAPSFLAFKSKANVVTCCLLRKEFGVNHLCFRPFSPPCSERRENFISEMTCRLSSIVESDILLHPDQWAWHMWLTLTEPRNT